MWGSTMSFEEKVVLITGKEASERIFLTLHLAGLASA